MTADTPTVLVTVEAKWPIALISGTDTVEIARTIAALVNCGPEARTAYLSRQAEEAHPQRS